MSETKKSILITNDYPKHLVDALSAEYNVKQWSPDVTDGNDRLKNDIKTIDGLLCFVTEKIDEELLSKAEKLKVVSTMSVGYDHIDLGACKNHGITVGHTPDVLTSAVAELTMTLLLSSSRRIIEYTNIVKNGTGGKWQPFFQCTEGLTGKVVGIVGLGRIGRAVAKRLIAFEPSKVLYSDVVRPDEATEKNLNVTHASFDDLLQQSDYVLCCCSLMDTTRNIFNKSVFKKMKPTAVLINTARGAHVCKEDLVDALKNGVIAYAALDVTVPEPISPDDELVKLGDSKVLILPHVASATHSTRLAMAELAAKNLINGLKGEPMVAQVAL